MLLGPDQIGLDQLVQPFSDLNRFEPVQWTGNGWLGIELAGFVTNQLIRYQTDQFCY